MKPRLRPDAKATIINTVTVSIEREHNFLYQSCLNCEHFKEKDEICLLVNKRPPVRVLVYSCEHWIDHDQIPY